MRDGTWTSLTPRNPGRGSRPDRFAPVSCFSASGGFLGGADFFMMCGIYTLRYASLQSPCRFHYARGLTASYHAPSRIRERMHDGHRIRIGRQCPHADQTLFLIKADPEEYPQWTWNYKERAFFETSAETLTDELRALSRLVTAKMKTVSYMIYRINYRRHKVRTGLDFQKAYTSPSRCRRSGSRIPTTTSASSPSPPMVLYADAIGIPLEQAANEILLNQNWICSTSQKTEKVRNAVLHGGEARPKAPQKPDRYSPRSNAKA